MSRLRQKNPNNYISSGNISDEFESVVRYLNATEYGNKTLGELLAQIFDDSGEWAGPIEVRLDSTNGLQYRVGTYTEAEAGWLSIVPLDEIRGEPGLVVGEIGAPIIYSRQDTDMLATETVVAYSHAATDELIVYVDGVLQVEGSGNDYTTSSGDGEVTFTSAMTGGETVTIYKIRSTSITNFLRTDILTVATQAVFPFVHDINTVLQVYKNGILQRDGGTHDYTTNPDSDTVTLTSAVASGNLISIITVENTALNYVTGLMTEAGYTDTETGKILYSKLAVEDGEITQAKVSGLVTHLATAAKITPNATAPITPATGDLWLDTSTSPNLLKFYTGTQWLQTSPDSGLPTFVEADANKIIRVNGTGTALEYSAPDYTSLLKVSAKGAANGVASLDSGGKLPSSQLPEVLSSGSFYDLQSSAVSNGDFSIQRIFKQKIQIVGVSIQCSAGSATYQLLVNGVAVGDTEDFTTSGIGVTLPTAQEIDGSSASKLIGFQITSASSLADLEVTLAYQILSA